MIGIQLNRDLSPKLKATARGHTLAIGETTEQNQAIILTMQPGESKEDPTLGVGIGSYTNEEDINTLRYTIRENFKKDHLVIHKMSISADGIDINATY